MRMPIAASLYLGFISTTNFLIDYILNRNMLWLLALIPVIGADVICNSTERDLKDKVVIVTGAAKGIGYEIAEEYLEQDVKVVILLDINYKGVEAEARLNSKYGKGKAVFMECDVTTDLEDVSNVILEKFKYVDVLVNNAGIIDEDNPRKTLVTNAIAPIEWSLKFWRLMRADRDGFGGTIINIDSTYGFYIDQYNPSYKASKYALMGFTKSLGHEYNYKRTCVRVVALCPGYTYTDMTLQQVVADEYLEEYSRYAQMGIRQSEDAVGKAAVEVFGSADTGTAWLIDGGGPVEKAPISLYV